MAYRVRSEDVARLRELGKKVAEIAADPIQKEHIQIWKNVNDFHMTKPALLVRDYPVFLMNVGAELTTTIEDEFLKTVEQDLLLKIYEWKHMRLHRVILPEVRCPVCVSDSLFGLEPTAPDADKITEQKQEAVSRSKHFERVLDTEEDLETKIQFPEIIYDEKKTRERLELMQEIFQGILEVKLYGIDYFKFVPWDDMLPWMNIEQGMFDFVMNPEFMHKAVRRYVDVSVFRAREYERLGLITSNNTNTCVGPGGYGYTDTLPGPTRTGIGGRLKDNWGDAADQILTCVDPGRTKEFAFDYEKEWADMFAYIYYGCCERLDNKVPELHTFSNLRKVSMSPFAKLENGMEKIGGNTVISFKPNSNYLTLDTPAWDLLEKELKEACQWAQKYHCHLEIIMKTIITLRGEPQRLWKWCELAEQVINKYYN